jgi:two-component system response regulator HydG
VLILDDDVKLARSLAQLLRLEGYHVDVVDRADQVEPQVRKHFYDVALVDLRMPEKSGIELLRLLQQLDPAMALLMMTAFGTVDAATQAFRLGVKDFLSKPIRREVLLSSVQSALNSSRLARETRNLRERLRGSSKFEALLGRSPTLRKQLDLAGKVAASDLPVCILGETGTGKGVLAEAIHAASLRAEQPLVTAVVAAVPAELQKGALFGHVAGAFTGATQARRGFFQEAQRGTLFLDEIGDLTPEVQVALLRALEKKVVRPVGAEHEVAVDVRILCATNADLPKAVAEGRFREDLFHRLDGVRIELPPLRQRHDDIPLLAAHFAQQAAKPGQNAPAFSPEAMQALQEYHWPGNVRELRNVVERAVLLAEGLLIQPEDCLIRRPLSPLPALSPRLYDLSLQEFESQLKRKYLETLLTRYQGDTQRVADHAGVHVTTIRRLVRDLAIDKRDLQHWGE